MKLPIFRVFVSSTIDDLQKHRDQVRDAIEYCEHLPIMAERFSPSGETPVDLCLRKVEEADVYVGIYAYRYGYCPDRTISITEMEFNKAREMRIPILCFLIDEGFDWTNEVEAEPGKGKLANFKEKINQGYYRKTFTTPEDLALNVTHALTQISHRLIVQNYQNQQNEINKQLARQLGEMQKTQRLSEERLDLWNKF